MLNYRFPVADAFTAASITNREDIGQHIHIAIEQDRGRIRLEADGLLRLIFEPSSQAPRWSELGIALADKAWLDCRSIHVKYCASAHKPARVRPALRLHGPEAFKDYFAPHPNDLGSIPEYFGADFTLSPRMMHQVHACDLHLFFDNAANILDLHDLVVTGLH